MHYFINETHRNKHRTRSILLIFIIIQVCLTEFRDLRKVLDKMITNVMHTHTHTYMMSPRLICRNILSNSQHLLCSEKQTRSTGTGNYLYHVPTKESCFRIRYQHTQLRFLYNLNILMSTCLPHRSVTNLELKCT